MRKTIFFKGLLLGTASAFLCACGGGGGGGGSVADDSTTISGVVSKGIFTSGTVKILGNRGGGTDSSFHFANYTTLATSAIDGTGNYTAKIGSYRGPLMVRAFGTYTDEASNTSVTISEAQALSALLPITDVKAGTVKLAVTPLTDVARRQAQNGGGTTVAITTANQGVSAAFGLPALTSGVTSIIPAAPTTSGLAAASDDQKKYAAALAVVSQYVAQVGSNPAAPAAADLQTALEQLSAGVTTSASGAAVTGTVSSPQVVYTLQQAATALAGNLNSFAQAVLGAGATATAFVNSIKDGSLVNGGVTTNVLPLKLAVTGSYSGKINGIQMSLTLPTGVTLRKTSTNQPAVGVASATGKAAGASVDGKVNSGSVDVAVISSTGFDAGEFATLYIEYNGTAPALTTFVPTLTKAVDGKGAVISGLTVSAN